MTTTKIALALVKAQKEFAPALKNTKNEFFKSKYADLAACVEAVIDALNNNGIYLMQKSHDSESGVKVETVLIHESGEEYSGGILHVPAAKNDPQGYGSALTYARRYSLMATCGIAPEDDDGNSATQAVNQQPAKQTTPRLPALTDEQAEKEYIKWQEVKSLLIDADGDPDNDRIVDEWGKLASNVRTAIKKYGESLKAIEQLDGHAQQHINDIAKA